MLEPMGASAMMGINGGMDGSIPQTKPAPAFAEMQCAGPGQSHTDLHSPRLADDQYLDPRFTRQWEKDWTEVFFNYGNSKMVGTVSFQAFGLSDAEHVSIDNLSSQLGVAQAWVTLMPNIGKLRLNWKVGAFWDKYGMSGKYDAGKYDMYLFGRLHVMGQTLRAEYPVGDFTLRASEGFGIRCRVDARAPAKDLTQGAGANACAARGPGAARGARELARLVQPLEGGEELVRIRHVEARAVVVDAVHERAVLPLRAERCAPTDAPP
jgi:hypothetical protein